MTTVHLGTFDAERWWRPDDLAELPAAPAGTAADTMDELLAAFCAPGDLLVTRAPMAGRLREAMTDCGLAFDHHVAPAPSGTPVERHARLDPGAVSVLRPYAVLPDTVALARRLGRADQLPTADVVARVNSKTWSNRLVRDLGLPGAGRVVRSVAELTAAADGAVVVKDPYGVSGRAMLDVRTPGVLKAITRTLGDQVARGRRVELLVQPKYAKRTDFSGHLSIAPDGAWELLGVQVMENRGFRHMGSSPASPEFLAKLTDGGYFAVLAAVAEALRRAGYWGPAGVDSMELADGTIVPVLEINARRSLGLVSLTLDRRVAGYGLRCHLRHEEFRVAPGRGVADLLDALRGDGTLYKGGSSPGVLVLSGSALAAPGGRVCCALVCAPGEAAGLRSRLLTAAVAAGLTPR
jgi:hypothetical protein